MGQKIIRYVVTILFLLNLTGAFLVYNKMLKESYSMYSVIMRSTSENDKSTDSSSDETFRSLYSTDMPSWLIDKCETIGFEKPTTVQNCALSYIFGGKDVILQAQTGSGKTLAYALPIISKIDPTRSAIQALIIVPTRELGLQVSGVLKQLASSSPNKITVMSLVEGSNNRRQQIWAVAEPPHIVVGNPR